MKKGYVILLVLVFSILGMINIPTSSFIRSSESVGSNDFNMCRTRILTENYSTGGYWYDDFHDDLGISSSSNIINFPIGLSISEVVFEEDFESYADGTDIFSTGNWSRHLITDAGTFTADNTRPHGAVSNTIGNHYNSDTSTHSVILSKKFDIQKGIFQIWAATNKIDPGYDSTTGFWLMGDDNDAPTGAHRVFATSFTSGGFDIYNGQ
jgi:hypothetical protein